METIATILLLAMMAIGVLHWWFRGGPWTYLPDSRSGWVVFGLPIVTILVISALVLLEFVDPAIYMATLAGYMFLDLSYVTFRRERQYRERARVA